MTPSTSVGSECTQIPEGVDALPSLNIPNFAGAVDGASDASLTRPIELTTRDFTAMPREGMDTPTASNIPKLGCMIKRTSDQLVPRLIEA